MSKAILMYHTPLVIAEKAIRGCYDSMGKSDLTPKLLDDDLYSFRPSDCDRMIKHGTREIIHRVGNKLRHSSTLEHLNYTFELTISRAVLQEVARHRHASLSVKSTRYTLTKDLAKEAMFDIDPRNRERVSKYCVLTGDKLTDEAIVTALEALRKMVVSEDKITNDKMKFALPEAFKTKLTWTINARSLQNFLKLRSSKQALWEIQELARDVFEAIPIEHKFLFAEFMNDDKILDRYGFKGVENE